jgi:hypothetical protein
VGGGGGEGGSLRATGRKQKSGCIEYCRIVRAKI